MRRGQLVLNYEFKQRDGVVYVRAVAGIAGLPKQRSRLILYAGQETLEELKKEMIAKLYI